MKKLLFISALFIFVGCCGHYDMTEMETSKCSVVYDKFNIDGHSYLIISKNGSKSNTILHDVDCKKCIEKQKHNGFESVIETTSSESEFEW